MRTLIDTNVLIALEDNNILESRFSDFYREAIKNSKLLIHPVSRIDIGRDKNKLRQIKTLSKLAKYQELTNPPEPTKDFLIKLGISNESNDIVDANLLYSVLKNSVNFLVTEDKGIHRKAIKFSIQERVLNVDQAASLFLRLSTRDIPDHTLIEYLPVHNLDISDNFFDSLREDYGEEDFNNWFKRISQEGRSCWTLIEDNNILALNILKEEEKHDFERIHIPTLKLCTFKVSDTVAGRKIGELLLKLLFHYAQRNHLKSIYVTVLPKYPLLISFFKEYGFEIVGKKDNENIMMKNMILPSKITSNYGPLLFAKKYYPNYLDTSSINKYLIPIQPQFHNRLFPDCKERQTTIDEFTFPCPEGNTIKKAYLCNSNIKRINGGDILLFYRSHDKMAITSIGVVEKTIRTQDPQLVVSTVSNRTVYTYEEITSLCKSEVLVIIFRHMRNFNSAVHLSTLRKKCNIKGQIQSIREITHDNYLKINQEGND